MCIHAWWWCSVHLQTTWSTNTIPTPAQVLIHFLSLWPVVIQELLQHKVTVTKGYTECFFCLLFRFTVHTQRGWAHVVIMCCRLMSSGSLRKLLAGWNEVCQLAEKLERSLLEVLDLQHNSLTELPHNLFIKAQRWTQWHNIPLLTLLLLAHFVPYHQSYFWQVICSSTNFVSSVGISSQFAIPKCVSQ